MLFGVSELSIALFKGEKERGAEDSGRDELAEKDGRREKPHRILKHEAVFQYEGNDDGVCRNGGNRDRPFPFAEKSRTHRTYKGRQRAEDDVENISRSDDVSNETTDGHTGHCRRREKRKHA